MGIFDILNIRKADKPQEDKQEEKRKSKSIMGGVIETQLYRFQNSISLWKNAIDEFEDVVNPTNEDLIQVYNDTVLDSHLSALIDARKNKTLSKDFKIEVNGKEDVELTELLSKKWFNDFMSFSLDAEYFGYTLVQFGDIIDGQFKDVSIVKREYVDAKNKIVRYSPQDNKGVSFVKGKYAAWTLGVGTPCELGILHKAAPLTIYKKSAIGAWAEFCEIFGSPMRIGRTNVRDEELRDNMYEMLANMSHSSYGVFDHDDTIELVESQKTDAYEVFDKQIERLNSELSKLILGSTMTIDDGSSRSQSEVHEKTSSSFSKKDAMYFENLVNNELIPFLEAYHGYDFKGGLFRFDDTENLSVSEQFERDIKLLDHYRIPVDYINEKYGVPVEQIESVGGADVGKSSQTPQDLESFIASIDELDICCENIDSSDAPEPDFGDQDGLFKSIYEGETTVSNLPLSLYLLTAEYLSDGIKAGINDYNKLGLGYLPDQKFYDALRDNAFKFASAKTFQEVRLLSNALLDENGEKRSFASFKKEAKKISGSFNKNWIKTEYSQAFNGSQMASKWEDILSTSEDFPKLRYITAGDGRVRKSHEELDGVVRPISDVSFWSTYYPPNGWNCRCDVLKEMSDEEDTDISKIKKPKLDAEFNNNVGVSRVLFSPEHPYFIVEDQYKGLASRNFGLPSPKPDKL